MKPYYEREGCRIFLGDAREVAPTFSERGVVIFDPPYSAHVHSRTRAGARSGASGKPLYSGTGQVLRASYARAAELGFAHLTASLRRALARESARLAARWVLVFSDTESSHLWRRSFQVCGLDYARTGFWRKVGGTPQFTGDRPAIASEAITICHPQGRKRWNGGGRHGLWDEDFEPGEPLWYDVPIVLERVGSKLGEPRLHTAQKPERLMVALVEDFTEPGEVVYDLTAGVCSTGIGCLRAAGGRRRFTGVELDERWAERGAKRLDAELTGDAYHVAQGRKATGPSLGPLFGGGQ